MSRVNASASILDQLKFSKVGARLAKKGGPKLADLVEKINKNAATSINSKPQTKDAATDQSEARATTSDTPRPSHIQGSGVSPANTSVDPSAHVAPKINKRPRENDGSKLQPAKKQAMVSTVPGLGTPANRPQGAPGDNQRRIFAKKPPVSIGISTAPKPKVTHVVPKQSSFFKDLKSATKLKPQIPNTAQRYVFFSGFIFLGRTRVSGGVS
jgi:hypothetical protein